MQKASTFLMFEGKAEEAITLYTSVLKDSAIKSITRYGANEGGAEGSVQFAVFTLTGQEYICIDSPAKHGFTFTPSISLYVTSDTEAEIDELFTKLSAGGNVLMPLSAYPFSKKFAWFTDQFGISWQLCLSA